MTSQTPAAAALVHRLLAARYAYDGAACDGASDFGPVTGALDAALAAFIAHRCSNLADLVTYANAMWSYAALERAEVEQWAEDATAPLAEFWPCVSQCLERSRGS
jgi:hypothetical protein